MKKIFFDYKEFYVLIILLSTLFSCRKNQVNTDSNQSNSESSFTINIAQDYYLQNLKKNFKADLNRLKYNGTSSPFAGRVVIRWKYAKSFRKGEYQMVEAPVLFEKIKLITYSFGNNVINEAESRYMAESSFSKFLIYRDAKGQVLSRIVTFMPDKEYALKYGKDASNNSIEHIEKNFSGYVEFRTLKQKSLFIYRIVGGKLIQKVRIKRKEKAGAYSNKSVINYSYTSNCNIICDAIWEMECFEGDSNPETSSGYDMTCEYQIVGYDCYEDPMCYDEEDPIDNCDGPDAYQFPECIFTGDPCLDFGLCDDEEVDQQVLTECLDAQTDDFVSDIEHYNEIRDVDEMQCMANNLAQPVGDLISIFPSIYEAIAEARATQGGSLATIDWEGVINFGIDVAEAKQNILECFLDVESTFESRYWVRYAQLQASYYNCYNP